MSKHSYQVMMDEIEREIRKRREVYPRLVMKGAMRRGEADELIAIMESVLAELIAITVLKESGRLR